VIKVEWEPNNSSVFASSSADRRIRVWDISKIGQEIKAEDAVDGPPELLVLVYMLIKSLSSFMVAIVLKFLISVGIQMKLS
jgi:WD40 repeat protein